MAGVVGKLEAEIEVKSNADKFWNAIRDFATILPKVSPSVYKSIHIIQGDAKVPGSIIKYTLDMGNEVVTVTERIEDVDDAKRTLIYSVIDGDLLKYFKSNYKGYISVTPKGDDNGSIVKWSAEFEKGEGREREREEGRGNGGGGRRRRSLELPSPSPKERREGLRRERGKEGKETTPLRLAAAAVVVSSSGDYDAEPSPPIRPCRRCREPGREPRLPLRCSSLPRRCSSPPRRLCFLLLASISVSASSASKLLLFGVLGVGGGGCGGGGGGGGGVVGLGVGVGVGGGNCADSGEGIFVQKKLNG
ncbi:MLP-like protein [Arachis hypogaea]|nr:MLP-like protein [Arachis hypogaea]